MSKKWESDLLSTKKSSRFRTVDKILLYIKFTKSFELKKNNNNNNRNKKCCCRGSPA